MKERMDEFLHQYGGATDPSVIDMMLFEMEASGLQKVLDYYQEQLDVWLHVDKGSLRGYTTDQAFDFLYFKPADRRSVFYDA